MLNQEEPPKSNVVNINIQNQEELESLDIALYSQSPELDLSINKRKVSMKLIADSIANKFTKLPALKILGIWLNNSYLSSSSAIQFLTGLLPLAELDIQLKFSLLLEHVAPPLFEKITTLLQRFQ